MPPLLQGHTPDSCMTRLRAELSLEPHIGRVIVLMLFTDTSPVVFTQATVNWLLFFCQGVQQNGYQQARHEKVTGL